MDLTWQDCLMGLLTVGLLGWIIVAGGDTNDDDSVEWFP